ncbi:carbohydrate ABC transporter permease [Clostridium sp. C2-6-12]|uniref:carbohydrate ABC transporter permease n=1 Tax=Clostridium sp. C2-6-12 TaxID=2698832 RepID=UPI001370A9E6|nr:carbohydrate ABC transporter permease [Clostridium sp. C2-6-12]
MNEKFSFKKGHRSRAIFLIFAYTFLVIFMLAMIIPVLKVFVDSVDPSASAQMRIWPKQFDFGAYEQILSRQDLFKPFIISLVTTIIGTAVGLLLTTLAAYVIIQKNMPGNRFFVNMILFTMLFNGGLIPTYLTVSYLGLMNNFIAVIIPVTLTAYNIILMKSFFQTIPQALYEAAELDGCTPIGIFWRIVLPLSKPALASIGLFIAVAMWNDFMHFQLYIQDPMLQNFQLKVRQLVLMDQAVGTSQSLVSGDMLKSAVIIVVMAPFLAVYPFIQKYFQKGVTLGGVKE